MKKSLNDKLKALPQERQDKIQKHANKLITKTMTSKELPSALKKNETKIH